MNYRGLLLACSVCSACSPRAYRIDSHVYGLLAAMPDRELSHTAVPAVRESDGRHVYLRPLDLETDDAEMLDRGATVRVPAQTRSGQIATGAVFTTLGLVSIIATASVVAKWGDSQQPPTMGGANLIAILPLFLGIAGTAGGAVQLGIGIRKRYPEVSPGSSRWRYLSEPHRGLLLDCSPTQGSATAPRKTPLDD